MKLTFTLCSIAITTSLAVAVAGTASAREKDAALVEAGQVSRVREKLDRGIVALQRTDGTVYVGWRLLAEDPADIVFDVFRATPTGKDEKLATLDQATNYVDHDVPAGDTLTYWVVARSPGSETVESLSSEGRLGLRPDQNEQYSMVGTESQPTNAVTRRDLGTGSKSKTVTVDMRQEPRDYLSVPLEPAVKGFMQPTVADLDGDGTLDYVIKTPDSYIDPGGGNWHYSTRTYKIHAYTLDGKLLWKNDLGPAIELGTWYSPCLVYDFDGDGRAEVALKTGPTINDPEFQPIRDGEKGRVIDDREYLSIWDGATGKTIAQVPWPSREGYTKYSLVSRNLLGPAYLDGKSPAIIVARGTYGLIKIDAYHYRDRKIQRLWRWVSTQESEKGYHGDGTRNGSGSHFMHAADVDQDGRDEVIYGSFVLDDDGTGLWALRRVDSGRESPGGHADAHYVGDILPSHDGLEIFYGFEKWHERNGACLVDARTGKMIWGTDAKTGHFHKAGLCADIDATHAGMECYGRDHELSTKDSSHVWLWAADGTVIQKGNEADWSLQPETVYWDADLQRELILDNTIVNYPDDGFAMPMEGCARTILVADVLGDWREEVIRSTPSNELRIYTTTIPAADRRPTLLQDPIYRIDVANNAMGYGQTPMVTRCLERP